MDEKGGGVEKGRGGREREGEEREGRGMLGDGS